MQQSIIKIRSKKQQIDQNNDWMMNEGCEIDMKISIHLPATPWKHSAMPTKRVFLRVMLCNYISTFSNNGKLIKLKFLFSNWPGNIFSVKIFSLNSYALLLSYYPLQLQEWFQQILLWYSQFLSF